MAEHRGMSRAEEQIAARRSAEADSSAQHGAEASYWTARVSHASLRTRGNGGTRAQFLLQLQRTHGNRAVQRKGDGEGEYTPTLPPFLMGPATLGFDYLLHSLGPSSLPPIRDPAQPTVSEMVQEQIARVQGTKSYLEWEGARKHDASIDDAQRAITGLPPDWFMRGEDPPGTLETPQYDDVSPALNPWELDERAREMEMYEAMGMR